MNKKILGLAAALMLSAFITGGGVLFAQGMAVTGSNGATAWASPQSDATQGRIRSVADDFIRPDSYTSAKIENWFAFASFRTTGNTGHLGYAKQTEKAFIGVYYGGTFWAGITPLTYTEQNVAAWPGGAESVRVYTALPSFTTTPATSPNNNIAFLLGVADMGFRFSIFSDLEVFRGKDFAVIPTGGGGTNTYYESYKLSLGNVNPQIAWSMAKNLSEKGVRPYATLNLNFHRDWSKSTTQNANSDADETIGRSANYFNPILQVGLGGYTFYTKEAFRLSFDVEYRLALRLYNNEIGYYDGTDYKTIKIKGLNDTSLTENSQFDNWLQPALQAQWGTDTVQLRARLNLPLEINNKKTTAMRRDDDKLEKHGTYSSATDLTLAPDLRLGLQWRIAPKLALNAGGRIGFGVLNVTTTKGSEYDDGDEEDDSDYKTVAKKARTNTRQLSLGAVFNFTDFLFVEANSGIATNNNVNVFSTTDGVFVFSNILVGLKF